MRSLVVALAVAVAAAAVARLALVTPGVTPVVTPRAAAAAAAAAAGAATNAGEHHEAGHEVTAAHEGDKRVTPVTRPAAAGHRGGDNGRHSPNAPEQQQQQQQPEQQTKQEMKAFKSRSVALKVLSVEQAEGVGARVRRSIGGYKLRQFSPFLMLDEFSVAPPSGFFAHPHRGFQTVTYMLEGTVGHEDFAGHRGVIRPGDLQWMTAGRGVVHCELPSAHLLDDDGPIEAQPEVSRGLQLWVNLAAKDKMVEPDYQELKAEEIPTAEADGVHATVIAGEALGVKSRVRTRTPTHYLHFRMEPGSELRQPVPAGWNAFFYTLRGTATFCGEAVGPHHTVTVDQDGDGVVVTAGDTPAEFVLISGQPIDEPVVQHGPFVMNTREEIMEAMRDYQSGRNGFERAPGFRSEMERRFKEKFY